MVKMKFFKSLTSGAADLGGVLGGGSWLWGSVAGGEAALFLCERRTVEKKANKLFVVITLKPIADNQFRIFTEKEDYYYQYMLWSIFLPSS